MIILNFNKKYTNEITTIILENIGLIKTRPIKDITKNNEPVIGSEFIIINEKEKLILHHTFENPKAANDLHDKIIQKINDYKHKPVIIIPIELVD